MKKVLIGLSALIPIFSVSPILTNSQNAIKCFKENINMVSDNNYSKYVSDNLLTFRGKNPYSTYRIYINSKKDTDLPPVLNPINEPIGKGKKNTWYEQKVAGLSLDIKKYASNKDEFLKKYQAITASYIYMFNFWNSWSKWKYILGKEAPNNIDSYTFTLSANEYQAVIFTEKEHADNERGRLRIEQTWEDNILKVNLFIGVWYHWKAGSLINHGVIGLLAEDMYTLVSVPPNSDKTNVSIDKVEAKGDFSSSVSSSLELNQLDKKLQDKAKDNTIQLAWFKTPTIMTAYFYGSKFVGKQEYIFNGTLRWIENTLVNVDDNLLLNGASSLTRTMESTITNSLQKFFYHNSYGGEETSTSFIPIEYQGIYAPATLKVPFIYINIEK